jgi:glycosyl transferase family 1
VRRYLFGPVDEAYADANLHADRERGTCKVFGFEGADVAVGRRDTWEDVLARLPREWRPDFVALFLAYRAIPPCLWDAPVPVVGLAADWSVLWHRYRHAVPRCDVVFTDARGVRMLRYAGVENVRHGNLYGCARELLVDAPEADRDIDVLYVGSLHPAQKVDRLSRIGRIVRAFADDWNVVVRNDVEQHEYRRLLLRARIVFNHAVRGECNLRTFEAIAGGALLFQEEENEEVRQYLAPGLEYVSYTPETLEPLLERYLDDEPARARMASAAHERAASFSFDALWTEIVEHVPGTRIRATSGPVSLRHRFWEAVSASTRPGCTGEIEAELLAELDGLPRDAERHTMAAVIGAKLAQRRGTFDRACIAALEHHLRRAVDLAPTRAIFRLNLVEALWRLGRQADAAAECRRVIRDCVLDGDDLDAGHFAPAFDTFRVEWERAAWANAGAPEDERKAKELLVRWRAHGILAAVADDLDHYRAAVELRDDLWVSHAGLGRALVRHGRPADGARHLRRAAHLNPFDAELLPDLIDAFRRAGDAAGEQDAAEELRLLRRAADTTGRRDVAYAQEVVA